MKIVLLQPHILIAFFTPIPKNPPKIDFVEKAFTNIDSKAVKILAWFITIITTQIKIYSPAITGTTFSVKEAILLSPPKNTKPPSNATTAPVIYGDILKAFVLLPL